ncbi:hypothetical protein PSD17_03010 [Pseudonocardia sp. D17]|nr:hypothetical protein PSD17_03010 [Pseudonocardia sp. D17]
MPSTSRTDTGDGEPYTSADEAAIEAAIDDAWAEYESEMRPGEELDPDEGPATLTVDAQVEWAGSIQHSNGGVRSVRLDLGSERTGALRRDMERARQARERAERTGPAVSRTAKGWHAQIRELTGAKRGSDAADRAGLNPSARTLQAWLSEDRAPSKANQERIAQAYENLRNDRRDRAQSASREANHRLTENLTAQIRDRFGATVRFRDIRRMRFDD